MMMYRDYYGIIEGRNRADEKRHFVASPNHITVSCRRLRQHDYPHFNTQSNSCYAGGVVMPRRIPESEYHTQAGKRGFKFLGPYPKNVMTPTWWECSKGHRWKSNYNNIVSHGSGCRHCYNERRSTGKRIPESEYHKLAKEHALVFVGPYRGDAMDSTQWQCSRGHIFTTSFSNIKHQSTYCNECYRERNRGENHPSYKSDLTDEQRHHERNYPEYKEFVADVYERDDYTCQICHERGTRLAVHHIYGYTEFPHLRTDVDNGITLCEEHHKEYHSIYGLKAYGIHFLDYVSRKGVLAGGL